MERSKELSMGQSFLQSLKSIVITNLSNEQFGAEELSNEIGLSRSQVHRKLQKINRKSITQFIREIRLDEALELLKSEVGTSSEISYQVGFSSPAYFTKCFHEYFGYPPGEVKKKSLHEAGKVSGSAISNERSTIIPIHRGQNDEFEDEYRKLTTIMFSDISGYTGIMEESEKKALNLLEKNKKLHQSLIDLYHGKLLKEIGDAIMASFDSPSDAVHCAQQIMHSSKDEDGLKLHIGIHLGEVHFIDGDVYGDGVNLASRINSEAKEGEVLISEEVCKNVRNKENICTEEIGEKRFKNVKNPVRVFRVLGSDSDISKTSSNPLFSKIKDISPWKLIAILLAFSFITVGIFNLFNRVIVNREDAPIITILPLVNSSSDPRYDYLQNGLADGIISNLASLHNLIVISDRASSKFLGPQKSYREVKKRLKVDHLIEGSYFIAGNMIDLTIRYVDASTGQIWDSENYNQEVELINDLHGDIALDIVETFGISLNEYQTKKVSPDEIFKLSALEHFQKGKDILRGQIPGKIYGSMIDEAKHNFLAALQIEPNFIDAYIGLAEAEYMDIIRNIESARDGMPEIVDYVNRAKEIDPNRGEIYTYQGLILLYDNEWKKGHELFEKSIALNPNYSFTHLCRAWTYSAKKEHEKAIQSIDRAIQLDPLDMNYPFWKTIFLSFAGNYEQCNAILDIYNKLDYNDVWTAWCLGGNYVQQGEIEKAHQIYIDKGYDLICSWKNYTLGKTGDSINARLILQGLLNDSKTQFVSPFTIAVTYLGLDELDSAIYYLNEAYEVKDNYGVWLVNSTVFDPLRDDDRFQNLLDKMGLSDL